MRKYRTYDIFISHASEDKDAIARPLAQALQNWGVDVWFDETAIRPGDPFVQAMDEGLARSRAAIVIASPVFFSKYWARRELDALLVQASNKNVRIVPILHNVTPQHLLRHSPFLSSLRGLESTAQSTIELALAILRTTSPERYRERVACRPDRIVLAEPPALMTFEQLRQRYFAESGWVHPEYEIPHIAICPIGRGVPHFLTHRQVIAGALQKDYYSPPNAKISDETFRMIIEWYRWRWPGKTLFDHPKARLVGLEYDREAEHLKLYFALARYYDNLVTHQLVDHVLLPNRDRKHPVLIRDLLEGTPGRLEPIAVDSPFANTIGRGGLVFTKEHSFIFAERANKVVVDADRRDLPVQGSADVNLENDTYDVFRDFKDEATKELVIEQDGWARLPDGQEAILLMGLLRNVARAGKPEFVFVAKTKYDLASVMRKAPDAEHSWEHRQIVAVQPTTPFRDIMTGIGRDSQFSPDCRAALVLLDRWCQARGLEDSVTMYEVAKHLFGMAG